MIICDSRISNNRQREMAPTERLVRDLGYIRASDKSPAEELGACIRRVEEFADAEREATLDEVLGKIEWSPDSEGVLFCAWCMGLKSEGHDEECEVAALRETPEEGQ